SRSSTLPRSWRSSRSSSSWRASCERLVRSSKRSRKDYSTALLTALQSLHETRAMAPGGRSSVNRAEALYLRYAQQSYSSCLHRLGDPLDAEDALQSTFLNAFRALERGVVPYAETAWLYAIARNVCLTRRRSVVRRRRLESLSPLDDSVASPERDTEQL